jgi:hypothetical protein
MLVNFPSEGFRLLLILADEADRKLMIGALLRPKKDSDLTKFFKPVGMESIFWAGARPEI